MLTRRVPPLAKLSHRRSIVSLLVFSSTILSGLPAFAQNGTDGTWIQIASDPNGPIGRTELCTVVDSRRDRLVLFGGYYLDADLLDYYTYSIFPTDTWALNLTGTPLWSRIGVPDLPRPGRAGAVAAYDSTADRVWMLAGYHRTSGIRSTSPKRFESGALLLDFGAETDSGRPWRSPGPPPRHGRRLHS